MRDREELANDGLYGGLMALMFPVTAVGVFLVVFFCFPVPLQNIGVVISICLAIFGIMGIVDDVINSKRRAEKNFEIFKLKLIKLHIGEIIIIIIAIIVFVFSADINLLYKLLGWMAW